MKFVAVVLWKLANSFKSRHNYLHISLHISLKKEWAVNFSWFLRIVLLLSVGSYQQNCSYFLEKSSFHGKFYVEKRGVFYPTKRLKMQFLCTVNEYFWVFSFQCFLFGNVISLGFFSSSSNGYYIREFTSNHSISC